MLLGFLFLTATAHAGHGLKSWIKDYYLDHPAPSFAPVAPPSPEFQSGGENADWELLASIPTGNPHTDIDFFTQGDETFASVGTLGTGPNGGGQTIVRLVNAAGDVDPGSSRATRPPRASATRTRPWGSSTTSRPRPRATRSSTRPTTAPCARTRSSWSMPPTRAPVRTGVQATVCTAHVFQQIPGQSRIFMGWYSQGTQVVDYTENADGTIDFKEAAYFLPANTNEWVSHVFKVDENQDGSFTLLRRDRRLQPRRAWPRHDRRLEAHDAAPAEPGARRARARLAHARHRRARGSGREARGSAASGSGSGARWWSVARVSREACGGVAACIATASRATAAAR